MAVFYPHTSNWDFPLGLLAKWAVGLPIRWVGKDSLFRGPLGPVLRALGGIPVDRRRSTGFIERLAADFSSQATLRVVIAPEGTRKRTEYWKSGFYHLARGAGVPLGLAYMDWGRRELGIGAWVDLTGRVAHDMDRIAAFYKDKRGRVPEGAGVIRLRDGPVPPRRADAAVERP